MTEEQATQKKGLGPLAWIAIGCGVLIVIAFIVMSAGLWFGGKMVKNVVEDLEDNPAKTIAKGIVMANPDLEMVESDDNEGTITVRNKETGEVATFDYSQIQEGRLSFETAEGSMTFDAQGGEDGSIITMETDEGVSKWGAGEVPDWLPEYPNAEDQQVAFSQKGADSQSGALGFSTSDDLSQVLAFFSQALTEDGFEVTENTTSKGGQIESAVLMATTDEGKRHVQVVATPQEGKTQVSLSYGANL